MKKYTNKIYLLKIITPDKCLYKIGSTKNEVYKRIKGLQTGCPYEIELVDYFDTEYGQMVERTLHNRYEYKKTFGEWFELDVTDEFSFKNECNKIEILNEELEKNKI